MTQLPTFAWRQGLARLALPLILQLALTVRAVPEQFIVVNISYSPPEQVFRRVAQEFKPAANGSMGIGIAGIFSYLHHSPKRVQADLQAFLGLAQQFEIPVVVQLDGESWWGARPDLWNWWDPGRPGYAVSNRGNVEWSGWSPDNAIKIAWRNWGRQLRVLPPPNLMSPRYRAACHEQMRRLVPLVRDWWRGLPDQHRHLLIGIKLGWESSIGVNAWYYPNGNALLGRPASEDPTSGLKASEPPARGVAQIGYAAVQTAGIRHAGRITEADLAEVVRRHLRDLCQLAAELGMPRDKIFTHVAGWKENELLYQAGLNEFSCPGWSFYRYAADPAKDLGVRTAWQRSTAPAWAAVEWLFQGPRRTKPWRQALANTLGQTGCRYLCVYNWESVRGSREILEAIRQVLAAGRRPVAARHLPRKPPLAESKWPDISTVSPDLELPMLAAGQPAPGKRVKESLPAWRQTPVYHVIYLPPDWQPEGRYPMLVEYGGNGGFTSPFGDVCTGRPEGCKLGYGLSAGREYIWVCLPYLNTAGNDLALQWWGDKPRYDPEPTLEYCRQAVTWVCRKYGGDAQRVVLCGFSRGAIACNFLGLHDDTTAKLWRAFVAYSHYDGVRPWTYPGADRASALARLQRLGPRPQFICGEGNQIAETRRYLARCAPAGDFQFSSTGFRNHNDAWILRPSPARSRLRRWLQGVCRN